MAASATLRPPKSYWTPSTAQYGVPTPSASPIVIADPTSAMISGGPFSISHSNKWEQQQQQQHLSGKTNQFNHLSAPALASSMTINELPTDISRLIDQSLLEDVRNLVLDDSIALVPIGNYIPASQAFTLKPLNTLPSTEDTQNFPQRDTTITASARSTLAPAPCTATSPPVANPTSSSASALCQPYNNSSSHYHLSSRPTVPESLRNALNSFRSDSERLNKASAVPKQFLCGALPTLEALWYVEGRSVYVWKWSSTSATPDLDTTQELELVFNDTVTAVGSVDPSVFFTSAAGVRLASHLDLNIPRHNNSNNFRYTPSRLLLVATTSSISLWLLQLVEKPAAPLTSTIDAVATSFICSPPAVPVTAIVGHDQSGRLFFGDADGGVYEFVYVPLKSDTLSWLASVVRSTIPTLSQKHQRLQPVCNKIAGASVLSKVLGRWAGGKHPVQFLSFDADRGLLYSTDSNSNIDIFSVAAPEISADLMTVADGPVEPMFKLSRVAIIKQLEDIHRQTVRAMGRFGDRSYNKADGLTSFSSVNSSSHWDVQAVTQLIQRTRIISVCPLSRDEGERVVAVAVTAEGARLFLKAVVDPPLSVRQSDETNNPRISNFRFVKSFDVLNWKLPPMAPGLQRGDVVGSFRQTLCNGRTFICAHPSTPGGPTDHQLTCCVPDESYRRTREAQSKSPYLNDCGLNDSWGLHEFCQTIQLPTVPPRQIQQNQHQQRRRSVVAESQVNQSSQSIPQQRSSTNETDAAESQQASRHENNSSKPSTTSPQNDRPKESESNVVLLISEQQIIPQFHQLLEGRGPLPDPYDVPGRLTSSRVLKCRQSSENRNTTNPNSTSESNNSRKLFNSRPSYSPWDLNDDQESDGIADSGLSQSQPSQPRLLGYPRFLCQNYIPPSSLTPAAAGQTIPARVFIILTPAGVFELTQHRPIDQLRAAATFVTSSAPTSVYPNQNAGYSTPSDTRQQTSATQSIMSTPTGILNPKIATRFWSPEIYYAYLWQALVLHAGGVIPFPPRSKTLTGPWKGEDFFGTSRGLLNTTTASAVGNASNPAVANSNRYATPRHSSCSNTSGGNRLREDETAFIGGQFITATRGGSTFNHENRDFYPAATPLSGGLRTTTAASRFGPTTTASTGMPHRAAEWGVSGATADSRTVGGFGTTATTGPMSMGDKFPLVMVVDMAFDILSQLNEANSTSSNSNTGSMGGTASGAARLDGNVIDLTESSPRALYNPMDAAPHSNGSTSSSRISLSMRVKGLVGYLSRILRPFWVVPILQASVEERRAVGGFGTHGIVRRPSSRELDVLNNEKSHLFGGAGAKDGYYNRSIGWNRLTISGNATAEEASALNGKKRRRTIDESERSMKRRQLLDESTTTRSTATTSLSSSASGAGGSQVLVLTTRFTMYELVKVKNWLEKLNDVITRVSQRLKDNRMALGPPSYLNPSAASMIGGNGILPPSAAVGGGTNFSRQSQFRGWSSVLDYDGTNDGTNGGGDLDVGLRQLASIAAFCTAGAQTLRLCRLLITVEGYRELAAPIFDTLSAASLKDILTKPEVRRALQTILNRHFVPPALLGAECRWLFRDEGLSLHEALEVLAVRHEAIYRMIWGTAQNRYPGCLQMERSFLQRTPEIESAISHILAVASFDYRLIEVRPVAVLLGELQMFDVLAELVCRLAESLLTRQAREEGVGPPVSSRPPINENENETENSRSLYLRDPRFRSCLRYFFKVVEDFLDYYRTVSQRSGGELGSQVAREFVSSCLAIPTPYDRWTPTEGSLAHRGPDGYFILPSTTSTPNTASALAASTPNNPKALSRIWLHYVVLDWINEVGDRSFPISLCDAESSAFSSWVSQHRGDLGPAAADTLMAYFMRTGQEKECVDFLVGVATTTWTDPSKVLGDISEMPNTPKECAQTAAKAATIKTGAKDGTNSVMNNKGENGGQEESDPLSLEAHKASANLLGLGRHSDQLASGSTCPKDQMSGLEIIAPFWQTLRSFIEATENGVTLSERRRHLLKASRVIRAGLNGLVPNTNHSNVDSNNSIHVNSSRGTQTGGGGRPWQGDHYSVGPSSTTPATMSSALRGGDWGSPKALERMGGSVERLLDMVNCQLALMRGAMELGVYLISKYGDDPKEGHSGDNTMATLSDVFHRDFETRRIALKKLKAQRPSRFSHVHNLQSLFYMLRWRVYTNPAQLLKLVAEFVSASKNLIPLPSLPLLLLNLGDKLPSKSTANDDTQNDISSEISKESIVSSAMFCRSSIAVYLEDPTLVVDSVTSLLHIIFAPNMQSTRLAAQDEPSSIFRVDPYYSHYYHNRYQYSIDDVASTHRSTNSVALEASKYLPNILKQLYAFAKRYSQTTSSTDRPSQEQQQSGAVSDRQSSRPRSDGGDTRHSSSRRQPSLDSRQQQQQGSSLGHRCSGVPNFQTLSTFGRSFDWEGSWWWWPSLVVRKAVVGMELNLEAARMRVKGDTSGGGQLEEMREIFRLIVLETLWKIHSHRVLNLPLLKTEWRYLICLDVYRECVEYLSRLSEVKLFQFTILICDTEGAGAIHPKNNIASMKYHHRRDYNRSQASVTDATLRMHLEDVYQASPSNLQRLAEMAGLLLDRTTDLYKQGSAWHERNFEALASACDRAGRDNDALEFLDSSELRMATDGFEAAIETTEKLAGLLARYGSAAKGVLEMSGGRGGEISSSSNNNYGYNANNNNSYVNAGSGDAAPTAARGGMAGWSTRSSSPFGRTPTPTLGKGAGANHIIYGNNKIRAGGTPI